MALPPAARLGFAALLLLTSATCMADDPWVRYENRHFVAYSDAPERKARALLAELETFRAAFLQVGSITTPADAPKAIVLVTATKKKFQSVAGNPLIAGFATSDGQTPLMVMPAQGDAEVAQETIRHEYGHTLLRYKGYDYPAWYQEGFAELVAAMELVDEGRSFRLGRAPLRLKGGGPPVFDWRVLLSDGFNPHELKDPRSGSSAYSQAWLLAHYATLGDNLKNTAKLQAYFDRLRADEPSEAAFEAAFGVEIDSLWTATLMPYMKRMPYYTIPFRPSDLDPEFVATTPAAGEVPDLFRWLGIRGLVDGAPRESYPPPTLAGRWAPARIGMACRDPLEIGLATGNDRFHLAFPGDAAGGGPEVRDYRYEARDDGLLRLEYADEPVEELTLHIRRPGPDLICLGQSPAAALLCGAVFFRCGT
ncbi:MAG: hypothetical protein JNK40_11745 [Chromatiales bacterium]|nr:hypothetical protein [Chromatiales bacterium]